MLFLLYTINRADRIALSVGLPTIGRELALPATLQRLILSAFFWACSGCQIPAASLPTTRVPRSPSQRLRSFRETLLIVNHAGVPGDRDADTLASFRRGLQELS